MRKFRVALWVIAIFAVSHSGVYAMTGDKLREAIAGKTVYVSSPLGEVAIRYSANGTMTCYTPLALLDGEKTSSDRGRWWIVGDKLCYRWQRWLQGKTHCVTMQMTGLSTVRWQRDDGKSGTARLTSQLLTSRIGE